MFIKLLTNQASYRQYNPFIMKALNTRKKWTILLGVLVAYVQNAHSQPVKPDSIVALHESAKALLNRAPDSSIHLLNHALSNPATQASDSLRALTNYYLGIAYYFKGYYRISANFYQQALESDYARQYKRFRGYCLNNLGIVYDLTDQYRQAIVYYLESLEIDKQLNRPDDIANTQINIALLYLNNKQPGQAADYLNKARQYFEATDNDNGRALAYHNLWVMGRKQKSDSLHYYIHRALYYYKKAENTYEYVNMLGQRALYYLGASQPDSAARDIEMALQLSRKKDYNYLLSRIRLYKVRLMLIQNNLPAADNLLQHIETFNQRLETEKRLLQSVVMLRSNSPAAWLNSLDKLMSYRDSVEQAHNIHLVKELEIQYETQQRQRQIEEQQELISEQRKRFTAALGAGGMLLMLLFIIGGYHWRLQKSYRSLYSKEQQLHARQKEITDGVIKGHSAISDNPKIGALWQKINQALHKDKLHLNPRLTIEDLASYCTTNKTYVYQTIKHHTEGNFNDFINRFRVEEAERLLSENRHYTMETIAQNAGFNSRSSFYRIFKEKTGLTPKKYRDLSQTKTND